MNRLLQTAAYVGKFSLLGLAVAAVAIVIASRGGQGAGGGAEGAAGGRISYSEAVQASAPAVVSVYTSTLLQQQRIVGFARDPQANTGVPIVGRRYLNQRDLGSGVIVTADGSILTNNHVIQGADSIWVGFWDGRLGRAEVVGSDPETDLAVLRVTMEGPLPTIHYGRSSDLRVGDVVLAIGNPLGLGRTVTMGIVSGTGRSGLGVSVYENLIQTDAAINRGNSGGALVNARGDLVGINTATIGAENNADGIGFAIPIETAQDVLQQILANGEVVRVSLGIEMVDGRFSPRIVALAGNRPGVIVSEIHVNGPGHLAGLEPGDYLTRFGDTPVTNIQDLYRTIADTAPGTRVELELWREGQRIVTTATLIQRPPQLAQSG